MLNSMNSFPQCWFQSKYSWADLIWAGSLSLPGNGIWSRTFKFFTKTMTFLPILFSSPMLHSPSILIPLFNRTKLTRNVSGVKKILSASDRSAYNRFGFFERRFKSGARWNFLAASLALYPIRARVTTQLAKLGQAARAKSSLGRYKREQNNKTAGVRWREVSTCISHWTDQRTTPHGCSSVNRLKTPSYHGVVL